MSVLNHIVDKHEWLGDDGYAACVHGPLTDTERREKAWLKSGSPAHKALQSVVTNKKFLKDMEMVRTF